MRFPGLLLVFLLALTFGGCAPSQKKVDAKVSAEQDAYEELAITPGRYLEYLRYKKKLSPPLVGAPEIPVTPQFILSNECGVCVINSVGAHFKTPWNYEAIKADVLGTHAQGTSLVAIANWFKNKGYEHVVEYRYERGKERFLDELSQGSIIIPLIYAFRDGFGPNHFVIVSYSDDVNFNVVDSRIGVYSEPIDFFISKRVLVLGQWIAVRP